MSKVDRFRALHVPGDPLVLFNIWDAGSARAVAGVGAQALATGSYGVAEAHGHRDGETFPLEAVLASQGAAITAGAAIPAAQALYDS